MLVYNYHPTLRYYVSAEEAFPSPEEPGVWLMPPHSTTEEPPETKENEVAIWSDIEWEVKELPPREVVKVCPLLRQPCIKDLCEWFVLTSPLLPQNSEEKTGKCAVLP